ncbi:MAG TPA: hypothetical protein VMT19_12390 [Thermoanaerobaculaceae bacterium]|nr:hypothetical protein [Thermoanaerobaculaceae bacterium]
MTPVPIVAAALGLVSAAAAAPPRTVTLPFTLDHNRMIAEAEFLRPDGSLRKALAWVDTGNQFLMLGEGLARELGLDVPARREAGAQYEIARASRTPGVRLAGLALATEGVVTKILVGARSMPGVPAEANLPATLLLGHRVVFDYPAGRITVAGPGPAGGRGVAIPCRVNPETGLFEIEATLDGEPVRLGVDNGSSYTWVSATLTTAWLARHREWSHAIGAVGAANFFGFDFETTGVLVRLPEVGLGPLRARGVGVLGIPQALFDWYSAKSAGAVAGFLGANVLRGFRVEVDYPSRMTYWEPGRSPSPHDLDTVGVTLRPEANGAFTVVGVAAKGGKPAAEGVVAGDTLLRVESLDTTGASMGAVADALRGTPGARRTLVLERAGHCVAVETAVVRFP